MVGWATSNYFVGAIQEIPRAKEFIANFNKAIVLGKKETLTAEASLKKEDLTSCPSVSPYLSKFFFSFFLSSVETFHLIMTYVQKSTDIRNAQLC